LVWLIMIPAIISLGWAIHKKGWTLSRKVLAGVILLAGAQTLVSALTS
jgi:hypothetical protein